MTEAAYSADSTSEVPCPRSERTLAAGALDASSASLLAELIIVDPAIDSSATHLDIDTHNIEPKNQLFNQATVLMNTEIRYGFVAAKACGDIRNIATWHPLRA
jgi:hypothetical protein